MTFIDFITRRRPLLRTKAPEPRPTWTPERNDRAHLLRLAGGDVSLAQRWIDEDAEQAENEQHVEDEGEGR